MVIDGHVEDPPAALDELGVDIRLLLQGGRQTGGPWLVVSLLAVLYAYFLHIQ